MITLPRAKEIVTASLTKGESLLMVDVSGICEKLSPRAQGYVRGTFTAEGRVTWAEQAYKPLPIAFRH